MRSARWMLSAVAVLAIAYRSYSASIVLLASVAMVIVGSAMCWIAIVRGGDGARAAAVDAS